MKSIPVVTHIEGKDGLEILEHFADHQSGLLICRSGSASFSVGTQQSTVLPGDFLILIPFSHLTFGSMSPDFKGTLCMVDLEFVFSAVIPVNLNANMQFLLLHPLSHPSEQDMAVLISLINLIEQRSQFTADRPLSQMTVDHLIHALAYQVLDSFLDVSQNVTKISDSKESIMVAFHSHLSRDYPIQRSVSYYARLQNLTPRYFSTAIKKISGHTPMYWINNVTAAEAKRLMRNSKLSIKEIAYSLNFTSPTFFSRWYRECTGETPSQYRTRYRIILAQKD